MSGFLDEFTKNYGSEVSEKLSSNLGIGKDVAAQLIPQVLPLVMGGMKKQMQERGGADRADHILKKHGSSNVLDDIGGLFASFTGSGSETKKADPALGGLLGDSGHKATESIASKFGLNMDTAMKVIPMLAPVVLGALSKKKETEKTGSTGIAALIDQDGDGDILDDVVGFLGGALSGGGSKKGGGLGGLLGGLLD
jgi:hypothetical protein